MNKTRSLLNYFILIFHLVVTASFAQVPDWDWAKSVSGSDYERGTHITTDVHGNIYSTGFFYSDTITFGHITLYNPFNMKQFFLVKYDPNGNVVWANSSDTDAGVFGTAIAVDRTGNIYLASNFYGKSGAPSTVVIAGDTLLHQGSMNYGHWPDILLMKYDTDGKLLWSKSGGGTGDDVAYSIAIDNSGNPYVAGHTVSDSLIFGTTVIPSKLYEYNVSEVFIIKFDENGNILWGKTEGDQTGGIFVRPHSIACDSAGNAYLTGAFGGVVFNIGAYPLKKVGGSGNSFIAKYNSSGKVLWARSCGGSDHGMDTRNYSSGVEVTKNGNIYITGIFTGAQLKVEDITLENPLPKHSFYVVKYDNNGKVIWAKSGSGNNNYHSQCMATDAQENVYVAGSFSLDSLIIGTQHLINMRSRDIVKGYSLNDIFISMFNSDGELVWVTGVHGNDDEVIESIAYDRYGDILVTGDFRSSLVGFGRDTLYNQSDSEDEMLFSDMFLAKLATNINSVDDTEAENTVVNIYPNPSKSTFHIPDLPLGKWTITVYSIEGQIVYRSVLTDSESIIDLSGNAKGTYFYQLQRDMKNLKAGKLILE